jgi:CheY-like chemotaxis protein
MAERDTHAHVLVLSDAQDIHSLIRELLVDEGHRVTSGSYLTGDIGAVTSQAPDVILIDCNRMDLDESVDFLRTIRSYAHLRDIPIVACTSAVRVIDNYLSQIEELNLQIVKKPFDINNLAIIVADSLDGWTSTTRS